MPEPERSEGRVVSLRKISHFLCAPPTPNAVTNPEIWFRGSRFARNCEKQPPRESISLSWGPTHRKTVTNRRMHRLGQTFETPRKFWLNRRKLDDAFIPFRSSRSEGNRDSFPRSRRSTERYWNSSAIHRP